MTAELREIQYLVLPNAEEPFLLARVRWPDVYQAISAVRPYWQDDPGLFDLPYAPNSTHLTLEEAERIATEWGARIPAPDQPQPKGPQLIRRMPSDWSKLSTAERRAWSIPAGKSTRRIPVAVFATFERPAEPAYAAAPPAKPRWWRRRAATTAYAGDLSSPYPDEAGVAAEHIDVPEPREPTDRPVDTAPAAAPAPAPEHGSDHAASLVMNLTTGTWHVDPVGADGETTDDDGAPDPGGANALSLDLSAPANKRLRRGRRTTKSVKAGKVSAPEVIDLTDAKESAGSAADHA